MCPTFIFVKRLKIPAYEQHREIVSDRVTHPPLLPKMKIHAQSFFLRSVQFSFLLQIPSSAHTTRSNQYSIYTFLRTQAKDFMQLIIIRYCLKPMFEPFLKLFHIQIVVNAGEK
jgi:hypothetical protein